MTRLSVPDEQIASLNKAIQAAETLPLHDRPERQSSRIKAVRLRVWKGPFRSGEIGRTALAVLRETGDWMRPYDVAKLILEGIGHDPEDVPARGKLTNSVGAYFKKHDGDLVESQGDYAKEWRVIR